MARTRASGVGERELALLRWVAAQDGATVGEAADGFGAADGSRP